MDEIRNAFLERFNTPLIADAAYRAGVPLGVPPAGIAPLSLNDKIAGPVDTVEVNNDLVSIIGALHQAQTGRVLLLSNRTLEVGIIGDLIVTEAKRKSLAGIIVDGMVRDANMIVEINVPVFSRGVVPIGPLKLPAELKGIGRSGVEVTLGEAKVKSGDWVFGDRDGVVFIAEKDLHLTLEWAEKSWQREEALAAEMRSGTPMGDIFKIESFLEKRAKDPSTNFNDHLNEIGRAI